MQREAVQGEEAAGRGGAQAGDHAPQHRQVARRRRERPLTLCWRAAPVHVSRAALPDDADPDSARRPDRQLTLAFSPC
jgi:hypothetical protein